MTRPKVLVKKLHPDAVMPDYAKLGDAGADLTSIQDVTLEPGESTLVKTGISIQLPQDYEAQVRPRSGLAYKKQITVLNGPGTVDEGYRGDVGVILINHGKEDFVIEVGNKIAQLVIKPVKQAEFIEVEELSDTSRGEGGFGSTGV